MHVALLVNAALCAACGRLHIPWHRFVVVSDPDILPAIIGRPGLPKWAAYENVVPASSCPSKAATS